ncbi:hypothetical protein GCM10018952_50690 [Streptosporangium vulgare]
MKAAVLAFALAAAVSCSPSPGEVTGRVAPPDEGAPQVWTLHVHVMKGKPSQVVGVKERQYEACPVGSLYPECAEEAR